MDMNREPDGYMIYNPVLKKYSVGQHWNHNRDAMLIRWMEHDFQVYKDAQETFQ
jgi:hypothetical protein